ncbi:ACT domain-containing protein [Gaoshiqia sp. Z1-71]|uniref:ACT domain-containing protein n=1 Tax=Gaoshiqia hydrogeniformans TaxID=3290090 RepID=UPI003BF7C4DA
MAYHVSIFLENKTGHFERVTRVLRDNGINIRSMTLTHTVSGWGILNLLVNKPEKACEALNDAGLSAALRKVLAFGMEDHPGGLDEILMKVASAGINILNAYGRVIRQNEQALLFIDVDDYDQALATLAAEGLYPLADKLVYGE